MSTLFDEKSGDWDKNEIVQGISSAVGSALLRTVPLHEEMTVLDFGAGTGLISSHVAAQVKNIVALDISAAMLDKLREKPQLQGKVETLCQDMLKHPPGRQFDLIISAMAMHHVEDTALLVQRFHEHLLPGGRVALADLDAEDGSFHEAGTQGVFHHGFDRSTLARLFEAKGFGDVKFDTVHVVQKERDYPIFLLTAQKN